MAAVRCLYAAFISEARFAFPDIQISCKDTSLSEWGGAVHCFPAASDAGTSFRQPVVTL